MGGSYEHLGCYLDSKEDRILGSRLVSLNLTTMVSHKRMLRENMERGRGNRWFKYCTVSIGFFARICGSPHGSGSWHGGCEKKAGSKLFNSIIAQVSASPRRGAKTPIPSVRSGNI